MFYLTTHSTHFIYGYMASDIWLRTILIVRKETRCRHIGYSFRLTARALLYAPSHRQDSTYHGLCYTSRGALAGTRNSSMGPHTYMNACMHLCMYVCIGHIHTHTQTHTNTYIHTYIHTYRQTSLFLYRYIHLFVCLPITNRNANMHVRT